MHPPLPRRYFVLRSLGSGGQGNVWLAADRDADNSLVAVKVWTRSGEEGAGTGPPGKEFLLLQRLAHPNVARVRGFGSLADGSGWFLASEYVAGADLLGWSQLLGRGRPWAQLIDLAAQSLSALHHVALRGVVHGDVKPQNLLVEHGASNGPDARPILKLIDFGASRRKARGGEGGGYFGTWAYRPLPVEERSLSEEIVDLYGLGVSLFEAATGRLPFAGGDPARFEEWRKSGVAASPRAHNAEVPAVLDALIRRLTTCQGASRFHSAAEAIEFLRARASLPPLPRPHAAGELLFRCRESFVQDLVTRITAQSTQLHLIVGPPSSGKTRILQWTAGSLQARGWKTVIFRGIDDAAALDALHRELLDASRASAEASKLALAAFEAASLVSRLPLAILIDDEPTAAAKVAQSSESAAFLRALAAELSRPGRASPTFACRVIAATTDPRRTMRKLSVERRAAQLHPLGPLELRSVEEAIRSYFAVDAVPDDLLRAVYQSSNGSPRLVEESLDRLAAHGVSTDFLGQLVVPRPLPNDFGVARAEHRPVALRLAASEARAMLSLAFAAEPMTATRLAALLPEAACEVWTSRLERLRANGLVVRADGAGAEPKYSPTWSGCESVRGLEEASAAEVRSALARDCLRRLQSDAPAPEALLAAAVSLLSEGQPGSALRLAVRARRRLRLEPGSEERLASLLRRAGEQLANQKLVERGWRSQRAATHARLRSAEVLVRLGRWADALGALAFDPPDRDRGGIGRLLWLRSEAQAGAGDSRGAIATLEELRERFEGSPRDGSPGSEGLLSLCASARLSQLYPRTGQLKLGEQHLRLGRTFLESGVSRCRAEETARLSRLLVLWGAAEAVHGEDRYALEHLNEALRVARKSGREDLALGPLHELAILHAQHQRSSEALEAFLEVESMCRRAGDTLGVLKAVYNRAIIHYRRLELEAAERLFREAHRLSDALGDHDLRAAVWLGLAGVLRERGRWLESLRLYRRVLRKAAAARPNDRAVAHNNLSELYLLLGRLETAAWHADLAFRIARRTRNRFLLGLALRSRGHARTALGLDAAAERDLCEAHSIAVKDGEARAEAMAKTYLGELCVAQGKARAALGWFRAALRTASACGDIAQSQRASLLLALAFATAGRPRPARRLLERSPQGSEGWSRAAMAARLVELSLRSGDVAEVAQIYREGIAQGHRWESFLLITWAAVFRARPESASELPPEIRESIARDFVRVRSARRRRRFERFWRVGTEDTGDVDAPEEATMQASPSDSWSVLTQAEVSISSLLEASRQTLGALQAWIFESPSTKPVAAAGHPTLRVARALRNQADAIVKARTSARAVVAPPFLFLRLAHPSKSRVLAVALPSEAAALDPQLEARIRQEAAVISLGFRLQEEAKALKEERLRHQDTLLELRRWNVARSKERRDHDTQEMQRELEVREAEAANASLASLLRPRSILVAASQPMKAILERLPQLAQQSIPILIVGESGVGKDFLARRIHELSSRQRLPFIAELCNVAESILEAELFGHEAGAYTGAETARPGLFERARGGTIYLDEITELSPVVQSRLLRVLEEKKVRPLGAETARPVDFRLLSSSSRSLEELSELPHFRKDLFYRIKGETLEIPPLRKRREDIPVLVAETLKEYSRVSGRPLPVVQPDAMDKLVQHPWPGNVRELENELRRILVDAPVEITAHQVFESQRLPPPSSPRERRSSKLLTFQESRRTHERDLLLRALEMHQGNASHAARALGITRRYLGTLLEKHAISLDRGRKR